MYAYTPAQWVLLFFYYSVLGWIWECCYVSARQGRWVDRGFLRGPALPIYGFGAILVLHATLPHAQSAGMTALLGAASATALEYAVGAAMEGLFHVRYWDYSAQRWNLGGYVCLKSTVAWGVFSVLLVRVLHPPADRLVQLLPAALADAAAAVLTAVLAGDTVHSARAALDLRQVLGRLSRENAELQRLSQEAQALCAAVRQGRAPFRRRAQGQGYGLLRQQGATRRRRASLEEALEHLRQKRCQALASISQSLETAKAALASDPSPAAQRRRQDAERLLERVRQARQDGPWGRCGGVARLLRSNPGARARRELQEALTALRRHLGP